MGFLTFLSPYLIFIMLLITYCRIKPRDFSIGRFQWTLLLVQLSIAVIVWLVIAPFDHLVAGGIFICVFIPTATAAPVITGMLGGSITGVATYSLLCNIAVAIIGPAVLAAIGEHPELSFHESFNMICARVLPLLVLPILTALLLRFSCRKIHDMLAEHQAFSFYIWAFSLFLVVGSSVSFVVNNYSHEKMLTMILLAFGALVVCVLQFIVGRKVGRKFGDAVCGGQSLGQKNTVLAIWLALAYLNPITSVAPAAYVAWQNIINSWQIYHHRRNGKQIG